METNDQLSIEDIEAIYNEVSGVQPLLSWCYNRGIVNRGVAKWRQLPDDTYGQVGSSCTEHTINFLWLILCIEGYEGIEE